jgi:CubicO group peptidase (beta-lactamase class C family)
MAGTAPVPTHPGPISSLEYLMKVVIHSVLLALCSATACATPASLPHSPHVPGSAVIDSARQLVQALVERERLPGFAITVSGPPDRAVLWHEGFGLADIETRTAATPGTRFRVGSVSKLLTATALMRLSQRGLVDLDVPVGNYLASLPSHLQPLTLRQLAGHQGGIRHYRGNEFFSRTPFTSLREALATFAADTLIASPGTRYAYSSYGYNLIGAVLEEVSDASFPELVRVRVLEPLRMHATVPDVRGTAIPQRAQTYSIEDTGVVPAPEDDLSGRWPSGGYLSSTDDMARLGGAVLAPGLLSAASLETMMTPQRLNDGAATSVGIGWRVSVDATGRVYWHHGGSSIGGAAFLLVYPREQLVIAMASNAFARWGEPDALAIAAIFLNARDHD